MALLNEYYDVHCHMFTIDEIPIDALINRALKIVEQRRVQTGFLGLIPGIGFLIPEIVKGASRSIKLFSKELDTTQERMVDQYRKHAAQLRTQNIVDSNGWIVFVPLTIHFSAKLQGGSFSEQCDRLGAVLKQKEHDLLSEKIAILPFLGVDTNSLADGIPLDMSRFLNIPARQINHTDWNPGQVMQNILADVNCHNGKGLRFLGIKFYPPVQDRYIDNIKYENIRLFLDTCATEQIPITVHSSEGGFKLSDEATKYDYSLASNWNEILSQTKGLKLNFAHFGGDHGIRSTTKYRFLRRKKKLWTKSIINLMKNPHNTVFSDLSFTCTQMPETLIQLLQGKARDHDIKKDTTINTLINQRAMWGTDWPMTLLNKDGYTRIVLDFQSHIRKSSGPADIKDIFANNAKRFLFCS